MASNRPAPPPSDRFGLGPGGDPSDRCLGFGPTDPSGRSLGFGPTDSSDRSLGFGPTDPSDRSLGFRPTDPSPGFPHLMSLLLFLACSVLAACDPPRPNILLVTFDTTRWDHMGYATQKPNLTPMLDAMAKRGTWFSTCLTAQPLTLPAHTTIMTGLYPPHHGVRNNGTYIVPESNRTLAEILSEIGYQTHAVISAYVLDSQFGLDQGFETYDDDLSGGPKQKMFMFKELEAEKTAQKGALWLRKAWGQERPFFMWLHFFDPHADYEPPADVAQRFPNDPYQAEIHYADRELGRVFKELELLKALDNTLIIFTSDHGDGLGEHGEKTHGLFIYEGTTRVPLLMAGPGVPSGKQVDQVVRTADIVPTVLDLLELHSEGPLDGASLKPLWEGKTDARLAYLETIMPRQNFGWSELRGLRSDGYKAIQAPRPELFALAKDPDETLNRLIVDGPKAPGSELFRRLEVLRSADPLTSGGQAQSEMDEETRRKLTALGYVWEVSSQPEGTRPDPKDRLPYWNRFQHAQQLIRLKQYPEAIAEMKALLRDDPENVLAKSALANALTRVGDTEAALAIYREMIASDPARDTPFLGAARLLMERGDYEEAEGLLRRVIELQPDNPEGPTAMGDLFLEQERFPEAEAWFRKAREVDPHSSLAAAGLGNCLNRAGRTREASAELAAALKRDPDSPTLTYNLAVVSEKLGERETAMALYRKAIQLDPEHSMSWNNLGSLLSQRDRKQEAIRMLAKAYDLDHENFEALYNLGSLLLQGGKAAESLRFLDHAVQLRPDMLQAQQARNRALEKAGRVEEAIAAWKALVPRHPPALLQAARLEAISGRPEEARKSLRIGLHRDGERFRKAAEKNEYLRPLLEAL